MCSSQVLAIPSLPVPIDCERGRMMWKESLFHSISTVLIFVHVVHEESFFRTPHLYEQSGVDFLSGYLLSIRLVSFRPCSPGPYICFNFLQEWASYAAYIFLNLMFLKVTEQCQDKASTMFPDLLGDFLRRVVLSQSHLLNLTL